MGRATFNHDTYRTYAASTLYRSDGALKSTNEVFSQRTIHNALDPKGIIVRESKDSAENPKSRPLIVALDVTGSMGMIADIIAKEKFSTLMHGVLDTKPINDPHIMFMAIGDVVYDTAPLQVSQFETDIRIAQQLSDIYLEGKGGGNNTESYDFAWYFAARKTSIDCFEKRGKKGYLFTIGDEMPPSNDITVDQQEKVFGPGQYCRVTVPQILDEVSEKWEIFHIVINQGNYAHSDPKKVNDAWHNLIGNRAIELTEYTYIVEVILAAMRISEGEDRDAVLALIASQDLACQKVLSTAFPQHRNQ